MDHCKAHGVLGDQFLDTLPVDPETQKLFAVRLRHDQVCIGNAISLVVPTRADAQNETQEDGEKRNGPNHCRDVREIPELRKSGVESCQAWKHDLYDLLEQVISVVTESHHNALHLLSSLRRSSYKQSLEMIGSEYDSPQS